MNSAAYVILIMPLMILSVNTSMVTVIDFVACWLGRLAGVTEVESGGLVMFAWLIQRSTSQKITLDIQQWRHILQYIQTATVTTVIRTKRSAKAERLKQNESLNLHPDRVSAPHFRNSVFFDALDLVQVKYEMLRQVSHEGTPKAQAAAMYGMSRPTLYQAMNAFDRDGVAGLLPQRRGPKGAHKLTDEVMVFIAGRQAEDPTLHARALAKALRDEKHIAVHPRSIERALERKKKR